MADLRIPPPGVDLVADLVNPPDPYLGDAQNVCRAEPRHLRLYAAAWMLAPDDTFAGYGEGLRRALALYEGCGRDLLNDKRKLTTAAIVAEVLQLTSGGVNKP